MMSFFEYNNGNIYLLDYPMVSEPFDPERCFLVYAENKKEAMKIAKGHLDGIALQTIRNFRFTPDVVYDRIKNVATVMP